MAYTPKAKALLALTDGESYDNWNKQMAEVRAKLDGWDVVGYKRVETFDTVLAKELVNNPARRAARLAILVAVGEAEMPKYPEPRPKTRKARKAKGTGKIQAGKTTGSDTVPA